MIEAAAYDWIKPLPMPRVEFGPEGGKPTVSIGYERERVYVITDLREEE